MKLINLYAISAGLALGITAATPQKQVLITYPADTPESALIQAKNSIEGAVSMVDLNVPLVLTQSQPGWTDTT